MATEDAVSASAKGATFLILLQIGSRGLTFALNQVLLRFLSPQLLGAAVRLELFVISAHHFARESLRVACQRQLDGGIQAAVNLSYLSIAAGVPIVLVLAQWYLSADVPFFVEGLWLCELAAVIELLSEPAFVAVQQEMLYKTRAAAEATAVVTKTLATAGVVFWAHYRGMDLGVLPFAVGELVYCTALTIMYIWQTSSFAAKKGFSLLPQFIRSSPGSEYVFSLFSKSLVSLSVSLYVQSGIKYILTQGDAIVSTALASLEDQGQYAFASNYGGLIARMVFRPIEDSCRSLFAKLCSLPAEPEKAASGDISLTPQKSRQQRQQQQQITKASIRRAALTLRDVLRFYTIASLPAVALGPSAAPLFLRLIAGSRWSASGAGATLGVYCYSIPLLAINGVSEAFVAATASPRELRHQTVWMGAFSLAFALAAYVFLRVLDMGAPGLVWANCVNMLLRVVYSLHFVTQFLGTNGVEFPLLEILPNRFAVAASAVVPGVLSQTSGLLQDYGLLGELVRVGAIGGGFVLFVAVCERHFLLDAVQRFRASETRA